MRDSPPVLVRGRRPRHALAAFVCLAPTLATGPTAAQETPLPASPPGGLPPAGTARPASEQSASPELHAAVPPPVATPPPLPWRSAAIFASGAVTALAAHETCHLLANLAMGNWPGVQSVTFMGFIPYFAIVPSIRCRGGDCKKHDGEPFSPGRAGLYTIVSAGLQCQQYEDEVILTRRPGLRMDNAPFRKGMLAFNTLMSIGYVLANWAGLEPTDGDIRGIYRDGTAPRFLLSSMILGIAAVDIARYFHPGARWLAWLNRVAKLRVTGIAFGL